MSYLSLNKNKCMKKYLLLFCILFLISISLNAQKEAYNWLFGSRATLTWNELRSFQALDLYDVNGNAITDGSAPQVTLTGLPSPIKINGLEFTSPMNTSEGCFSLSTHTGQLLFFSDGTSVWDRNGNKMPNGNATLNGHSSSAQSGIIFPYSEHPNQYVAVSLGDADKNNLSYSIIDMNENGGLGDIIRVNGNLTTRLEGASGTTGETVTAVPHSNKKDYWIIALGRGAKSYLNVWRVNKYGVKSTAPSGIYEIEGIDSSNDAISPNGYIKFSPDGKYFACWVKWGRYPNIPGFCVGKFDPRTGVISNLKYQIVHDATNSTITKGYGLEFSEDGKYLYACNTTGDRPITNVLTELHIYEFEKLLNAPNSLPNTNAIAPEKRFTNPAGQSTFRFNGLQMGPDKRIYIAGLNYDYTGVDKGSMFVIDNPNDLNNVKVYYLPNFASGAVGFGLPSYSSAWFITNIEGETDFCINTQQQYVLKMDTTGLGLVDLLWDFGDGNSAVKSISDLTQTHTYSKRGKYTITVTPRRAGNVEVPELATTLEIKVNNCMLPVNHNISNMEYK